MEPQVQYARTSDGVNIAFSVAGAGPPLVLTRTWTGTHAQLDWQLGAFSRLFDALARNRTLVTFDRRGVGLSDRDINELTIEKFTLDLEAVVDHLGLERFALMGQSFGLMVNANFALRQPERVSAFISLSGILRGDLFWKSPRNKAMRAMREADFDTYVETIIKISGNPRAGDLWRASITAEGQKAFVDASEKFDATELVSQLSLPSLLLYRQNDPMSPDEEAFVREIATRIPGARLVGIPWEPREEYGKRVVGTIDSFLGDSAAPLPQPSAAVHTILFTDLASSTALTQRLGDEEAQELLRAHNKIVREALEASGGTEIKHTGDGIMASFGSASGALECAVSIQRSVTARGDEQLAVHIGLNAGEPMSEESDLFGTAVQLARRICDEAEAGEILVSDVVRQLAAGKNFLFSEREAVGLKGFEEPVRLFDVRWRIEE